MKTQTKDELINEIKVLRGKIADYKKKESELNKSEIAFKESEEKFRVLVENMSDFVFQINSDFKIVTLNNVASKLIGEKVENIIGKRVSAIFPAQISQEYEKDLQKVFKTSKPIIKDSILQIKNTNLFINTKLTPVFDNKGSVSAVIGVSRDITERKKAEQQIIKAEKYLSDLMKTISDVVFMVEMPDRSITYVNEALMQVFGYSPEEVIGEKTQMFYPNEVDYLAFGQKLQNAIQNRISGIRSEHKLRKKNGELIWVEIATTFLFDEKKLSQVISVIRNVTERNQAAKKLQESEKHFKTLFNLMVDPVIIVDKMGIFLEITDKLNYLTGFNKEDLIGKNFFKTKIATPKSKVIMLKNLAKRMMGMAIAPYEVEILTKSGKIIPFELNAEKIDYKGKTADLVSLRDITERKKAEESLRESEEKYRILIENANQAIFTISYEGVYKFMNTIAASELGGEPKDFIGKTLFDVFPKKIAEQQLKGTREIIDSGQTRIRDSLTVLQGKNRWYRTNSISLKDKFNNIRSIMIFGTDITKQKEFELKLKESEKRYRVAVESIMDGMIVIDSNGLITTFNPSAEKMFGWSSEEMLGKRLDRLMPNKFRANHQKNVLSYFATGKPNGAIERIIELPALRKNGEEFMTEVSLSAAAVSDKSYVLAVIRDISERKEAEKKIRDSEQFMKSLFESVQDGISVLKPDLEIRHVNSIMNNWYKENLPLNGKKCYQAYHNSDKPCNPCPALRCFESGCTEKNIVPGLSGSPIEWIELFCYPIKESNSNKVIGVVEFVRDITERKRAEVELQQYSRQLQERNEELDAFSHTVAHDLKNPLGTILGFADLMLENYSELSKDEILNYLKIIISDSNKTQQIINSLLLFAGIRKSEIQTEELNMGNIIDETIKRLRISIEKSNAKIIKPDVWPVAKGYAPWIEEVWINYLNNAIKYGGSPPQIEIGVETDKAEHVPKGMLRFWVKDNGPGISDGNQKLLFKKFERLDQVKTEGHGLGLSIVSRIIEKLGGQVGMESNNGSFFYFTLPCSDKAKEKNTIISDDSNPKNNKLLNKLKILIVEDDEYSDTHLGIIIKKISKETLHAKQGNEAAKICRANPDIDLVLMDIRIPEMNGFEATRKIREFNKDIVIIAQTAYAVSGAREKALEAGCNDYITKPINKEDLYTKINKLLINK